MARTLTGVPVGPLSLDEYLSLPDESAYEVVDGILRPTVPPNKKSREAQRRLAGMVAAQKPRGVRVAEEEVVVLQEAPPDARIPDVVVFRADSDPAGETNYTFARDVLLVVEVVSPSSQTADRYEKPREYARNGIRRLGRGELR